MSISYNGLWKLLIDNNMNKTDLMNEVKLSSGTIVKRQIVAGANRRLFRAEAPVGVCCFLDDRMNSKVMPQIISAWIAALS